MALGWLSGSAKMDWIYKELRRSKEGSLPGDSQDLMEQLNVPQYYRFN